ncbi:MAG TPA: GLPGLI family protein [Saprospiraceae bacterium]|nr:GLPGLI family protein [Saprospiraceae bacterium]
MRNWICFFLLIPLIVPIFIFGQMTEGMIYYELTYNMHRNLPAEMEGMKIQIPEFRKEAKELIFNREASLMRASTDQSQTVTTTAAGGMVMKSSNSGNNIYHDLVNDRKVEQRGVFEKQYLIESSGKTFPWVLSNEAKKIAGKNCQKATYRNDENDILVEAWFSPEIPVSVGPDGFRGLPGAILHLDYNQGERVYTAVEVDRMKIKPKMLKEPEEGKRLSEEEFRKEMESMMESRGVSGSGGTFRVIRNE